MLSKNALLLSENPAISSWRSTRRSPHPREMMHRHRATGALARPALCLPASGRNADQGHDSRGCASQCMASAWGEIELRFR